VRILEVTNFFSPVHGGSAEVPYQLSKELAKRGHQVTIYTSDYRLGPEYTESIPGIKVHPFKTWLSLAKFYVTPGAIKTAKEEIRDFDVVHLHNYRTFQNIAAYRYARKYGIPYVLQAHGSLPRIVSKQALKLAFDKMWGYRLLRDASRVIAITALEAGEYRGMGVDGDKIEIVPNGIDLAEFADLPEKGGFREKYNLSSSERVVFFLGRIDRTKGLDLLVKAFAGLPESEDKTRLVIAGPDDGYLPSLRKLIAELGIGERVLLPGPLYGREKLEAYVDADVHVSFRAWEPFGITLLESCACGTPVICSTGCGIADIIDNQAGFAVPYDKEQLQQAMWHVLDDNELRLSFGKKGRKLVRERFNWSKILDQIEAVYESTRKQTG